jgi:hypothetical protein
MQTDDNVSNLSVQCDFLYHDNHQERVKHKTGRSVHDLVWVGRRVPTISNLRLSYVCFALFKTSGAAAPLVLNNAKHTHLRVVGMVLVCVRP